jgi:hypothetical protein
MLSKDTQTALNYLKVAANVCSMRVADARLYYFLRGKKRDELNGDHAELMNMLKVIREHYAQTGDIDCLYILTKHHRMTNVLSTQSNMLMVGRWLMKLDDIDYSPASNDLAYLCYDGHGGMDRSSADGDECLMRSAKGGFIRGLHNALIKRLYRSDEEMKQWQRKRNELTVIVSQQK